MIRAMIHGIVFSTLLFIFACKKEIGSSIATNTALTFSLSTPSEIVQGNALTVAIEVENADSLFALSFELHYDSALFETDTIIAGNLFTDPYLPSNSDFLSDGEVPVVLGELGTVQGSASGTACSIILKSEKKGTDLLYIRSLHMIKRDGSDIDGFNALSVETIKVKIIE